MSRSLLTLPPLIGKHRLVHLGLYGLREVVDVLLQLVEGRLHLIDLSLHLVEVFGAVLQLLSDTPLRGSARNGLWVQR